MLNLLKSLMDLIYRKKCYFCGNSKYSLKMCPKCYDLLEFADKRTSRVLKGCDIYCAGTYTKELQKLIRGLKYHKQKELAYYQAKFMYEYFSSIEKLKSKNYELVPVPLHSNRIKKRKYNHMELVCQEFSKLSGLSCNFNIIKRIKDTKPQYKLNRTQRLNNLSGAFEVDKSFFNSKPILIIDDICTTGSTFEEMINEFNKLEIYDITCFSTSTPV
ncbi:MAG: hypothetical protein MJ237_01200 [bacterium]|nr:hypothetical protein [bacterium]